MSILLVAPPRAIGSLIVEKLVSQGDEVRVVIALDEAQHWRDLGAYVAPGSPEADLIERAGQNVRTVVLFDPDDEVASAALEAAEAARIERVIVITRGPAGRWSERMESAGFDYVVLGTGRKRALRHVVTGQQVADAVDAADDLAGEVNLEVDLAEPESWAALGLQAP